MRKFFLIFFSVFFCFTLFSFPVFAYDFHLDYPEPVPSDRVKYIVTLGSSGNLYLHVLECDTGFDDLAIVCTPVSPSTTDYFGFSITCYDNSRNRVLRYYRFNLSTGYSAGGSQTYVISSTSPVPSYHTIYDSSYNIQNFRKFYSYGIDLDFSSFNLVGATPQLLEIQWSDSTDLDVLEAFFQTYLQGYITRLNNILADTSSLDDNLDSFLQEWSDAWSLMNDVLFVDNWGTSPYNTLSTGFLGWLSDHILDCQLYLSQISGYTNYINQNVRETNRLLIQIQGQLTGIDTKLQFILDNLGVGQVTPTYPNQPSSELNEFYEAESGLIVDNAEQLSDFVEMAGDVYVDNNAFSFISNAFTSVVSFPKVFALVMFSLIAGLGCLILGRRVHG